MCGPRCARFLAASFREAGGGERAECLPVEGDHRGAAGADRAGCVDAEGGDNSSVVGFADVVKNFWGVGKGTLPPVFLKSGQGVWDEGVGEFPKWEVGKAFCLFDFWWG